MAQESYQNKKNVSREEEDLEKMFWEEYAKYYKYIENSGPYRGIREKMEKLLEEKNGSIILDACCGIGSLFEAIIQKTKCAQLIAVDFNSVALKQAKEKLNLLPKEEKEKIKIMKLDLSKKLPFNDNTFDAIISNAGICYISQFENKTNGEAIRAILNELKRMLKPGGYVCWSTFISNINFKKVYLKYISEVFKQSPKALIAGLKLKKTTDHFHSKQRQELYHFLSPAEIKKVHSDVGLVDTQIEYAMAGQCIIAKAKKL